MALEVRLSTVLRDYVRAYDPHEGLQVPYTFGMTAQLLAESLGLPIPDITIVMVNNKAALLSDVLHDNDRVAYFPAVGGG